MNIVRKGYCIYRKNRKQIWCYKNTEFVQVFKSYKKAFSVGFLFDKNAEIVRCKETWKINLIMDLNPLHDGQLILRQSIDVEE